MSFSIFSYFGIRPTRLEDTAPTAESPAEPPAESPEPPQPVVRPPEMRPVARPYAARLWSSRFVDELREAGKLPPVCRDLWAEAMDKWESRGVELPRERMETYEDFLAYMRENGFTFPDRFRSVPNVLELIRNRQTMRSMGEDRPIAVIIAPTTDYNHAFEMFPMADTLVESGRFDVLYFECSNEDDVRTVLEATASISGRPIHTLVMAGHGSRDSLNLGAPMECSTDGTEGSFVDMRDWADGGFSFYENVLDPEGQILLWSCSNGAGGEDARNLANTFGQAAPGRRIISVGVPSNIVDLQVNPDLGLDVRWANDDAEYVALPDECY